MAEISPEWTAELKKGSVQLCLLALLAKEQKYGFQIIRELRERSDGFFDLKEGTLYPALRRLEERGFVESRWVEPESGNPRKYYRITEKGRRALGEGRELWERLTASARRVLEAAR
ncbi:MAG TPA: PadR family transcriptional regulator [Thermoplasmata archaeon]|nr:PadR family transcriptional regulator [Thermoplasmata archaeon]